METKENFELNKSKTIIKSLTQKYNYVGYVDLERRIAIRIKADELSEKMIAKFSQANGVEIPKAGEPLSLDALGKGCI